MCVLGVCVSQYQRAGSGVSWMWMECDTANRPCRGPQIPPTSPAKGPFLPCLQTLTHTNSHMEVRHTHHNTHCSEITQKQSESCGESSVRTVPLLIVRLLWRAISSGWRKHVCVCEKVRGVCVFSSPGGSVTWGVREFSIKIFLCNCRTLRTELCLCMCVHSCLRSFYLHNLHVLVCEAVWVLCVCACMHACVCVYVCGAGWHQAKVNRRLVSVLHAFSDLTGPVQALRHVNEVCGCVCLCKCVCIGDEGSQSIIHKSYCPPSMCVCTVCWERRQMS